MEGGSLGLMLLLAALGCLGIAGGLATAIWINLRDEPKSETRIDRVEARPRPRLVWAARPFRARTGEAPVRWWTRRAGDSPRPTANVKTSAGDRPIRPSRVAEL